MAESVLQDNCYESIGKFVRYYPRQFIGNKAKERFSKWAFQENQIFRKTIISYPLVRTRTYKKIDISSLLS